MDSFRIHTATTQAVPIIVSVPHCGVSFPDEIKHEYKKDLIETPDDTDWFVDRLYDFAPSIGITMITAVFSRWVIDLNRDLDSKPLYTDGRIITALCPSTTFLGEPIYNDERTAVAVDEVKRRTEEYYRPYHQRVEELLRTTKSKFGRVLLWDCHSIRQIVHTIQREKFPDLILGDADGTACSATLINNTLANLDGGDYSLSHNHPFKGGTITRNFGRPNEHQHALQLEMTKTQYMDDSETKYSEVRADKMRERLKRTLGHLAEQLIK